MDLTVVRYVDTKGMFNTIFSIYIYIMVMVILTESSIVQVL